MLVKPDENTPTNFITVIQITAINLHTDKLDHFHIVMHNKFMIRTNSCDRSSHS